MFDDVKQPEDMFSETDKVSPQPVPPTQSASSAPTAMPAPVSSPDPVPQPVATSSMMEDGRATSGHPMKIVLLVLAILVVIAAAFFISLRILGSNTPVTPEPPEQLGATPPPVVVEPEIAQPEPEPEPEPIVEAEPEPVIEVDTDKDGLLDTAELALGTDPTKTDSDADGLFDREELEVYKTNPLVADTDGDTYLDGAEVKAGYNPNGSGNLRQLPQ